jgi:outer membrane lipoprotein LolB
MYETRADTLRSLEHWSLDGKLAVSDGEDGGSGRLEWRAEPGLSELDFRGTLGRGAWQLDIETERAILNLANGDSWQAPDVSTLVREHVGWDVPVDALEWWVRGLAAPGRVERRDFDADGRMTFLSQYGWDVAYDRYKEYSGMSLPMRLEARRGEQHVKLAMRRWWFRDSGGNGP